MRDKSGEFAGVKEDGRGGGGEDVTPLMALLSVRVPKSLIISGSRT